LEAVTVSVGFDDLLDVTLTLNHPHVDNFIVVTSHEDRQTPKVCKKHGAICVPTDLVRKNGRQFNKGAAVNAGFSRFQYMGWRLHLDADVALPDRFRGVLFNHTHLDKSCIYGADRVNVVGKTEIAQLLGRQRQYHHGFFVESPIARRSGARFISTLHGYVPLGYFQLWHSRCQKPYPYSLGTAEHDDIMFATLWPESQRRILPSVMVYHLCATQPKLGENWDGTRQQPRLDL
jgi:hypothetical protein